MYYRQTESSLLHSRRATDSEQMTLALKFPSYLNHKCMCCPVPLLVEQATKQTFAEEKRAAVVSVLLCCFQSNTDNDALFHRRKNTETMN